MADLVTYQALTSEKLRTLQGVNTHSESEDEGAWHWRGTGWVKVVSNNWEILGLGSGEIGNEEGWIVIQTQRSFFTPAAIHVYSRKKEQLPEDMWGNLKAALMEREDLKDLVQSMFDVQHD